MKSSLNLTMKFHFLLPCLLANLVIAADPPDGLKAQKLHGRELYVRNCFVCHQLNGQGVPGTFPPLAKSDFLAADIDRAIKVLCEGPSGEIIVNGRRYAGSMPPAILDDREVADVFTYLLNSWDNPG